MFLGEYRNDKKGALAVGLTQELEEIWRHDLQDPRSSTILLRGALHNSPSHVHGAIRLKGVQPTLIFRSRNLVQLSLHPQSKQQDCGVQSFLKSKLPKSRLRLPRMPTILSSEADYLAPPTVPSRSKRAERPSASRSATKAAAAQVREARRALAAHVRNDWEFPSRGCSSRSLRDVIRDMNDMAEETDARNSAVHATSDTTRRAQSTNSASYGIEDDRVQGWQERTYASSDPSSGEDQEIESELLFPVSPLMGQNKSGGQPSKRSNENRWSTGRLSFMSGLGLEFGGHTDGEATGYGLEQPERHEVIKRNKSERKARRKQRLEEEMQWNEGLAFWTARRDAWCCARKMEQSSNTRTSPRRTSGRKRRRQSHSSNALVLSSSDPTLLRSQQSQSRESTQMPSAQSQAAGISRDPTFTYSLSPASSPTTSQPDSPPLDKRTTFLPCSKALLPATDPSRSSIGPRLYSSIYSKVVIQSLTPAVPVNLAQLVPALVDGWKRDGEWPSPSASTKAHDHLLPDQSRQPRHHGGESRNGALNGNVGGAGWPVEKGIAMTRRLLSRTSPKSPKHQGALDKDSTAAGHTRRAEPTSLKALDTSWALLDPQDSVSGSRGSPYTQVGRQSYFRDHDFACGNEENELPLSHTVSETVRKMGRALKVSLSGGSATSEERDFGERYESPLSSSTTMMASGVNVGGGNRRWSGAFW